MKHRNQNAGHASKNIKRAALSSLFSAKIVNVLIMGVVAIVVGGVGVKFTLDSFAAIPNGTLDIITYEGSANGGNEIGSVYVVTDQGGSGVQCSPRSGTTEAGGGSNHGHVHLSCPAASNGGPRTYKISSYSRDGFHVSGNTPHPPGDTFHVSGGQTTTLSLVLDRDAAPAPAPSPAPAPAPAPAPSPTPSPSTPNGTLDIITYEDSVTAGKEIGSVYVVTDQGGSGVQCTPRDGTTDAGSGNNHGHLHLTCPAARDGGPRTYKLLSAVRGGFIISGNSPHKPGDASATFHINGNQTTTLSIVLRRDATPAPAPAPAPSAPAPSSPPPTTSTPATSSKKNGSVQITTYVYHPDGSRTRIGNVNIHIKADTAHPINDLAYNCDDYNKSTDSGGGSVNANSNYGQLHFTGCWTNSGSQPYLLSYIQIPAGYSYRSFRVTGPAGATFVSGATVNDTGSIEDRFYVKAHQETRLEIWLNNNAERDQVLNGVKQVVTQTGTRFVPSNDSQEAKNTAAALTAMSRDGSIDIGDIVDGTGEEDEDIPENPPSTPQNVTAKQDDSGSINLKWDASTSNPAGHELTYIVERQVKGSSGEPEPVGEGEFDTTETVDLAEDLEYPQDYLYYVSAYDADADTTSEPATVEIVTTKTTPNVQGAEDGTGTDGQGGDGTDAPATDSSGTDQNGGDGTGDTTNGNTPSQDGTVIASDDQNADLEIPNGAAAGDLACDVSANDSTGADLSANIGDVTGDAYLPICRDDSGELVDDFGDDVDFSIEEDNADITDDTELYGYDGTDWVQIDTKDTKDAKHGNLKYSSAKRTVGSKKTTYSVKTKHIFALALINKKRGPISPVLPATTIMLILAAGIATRMAIRHKLAQRYEFYAYTDPDLLAHTKAIGQPQVSQQPTPPPQPSEIQRTWVTPNQQVDSMVSPERKDDEDKQG